LARLFDDSVVGAGNHIDTHLIEYRQIKIIHFLSIPISIPIKRALLLFFFLVVIMGGNSFRIYVFLKKSSEFLAQMLFSSPDGHGKMSHNFIAPSRAMS
jgi:hypothetical protein